MAQNHKFLISMTILDHLGRQLYRNFITVIGEAISNAWDADAKNVWIQLDRNNQTLSVLDDGHGMSSEDLDKKFLKIGYTKRGRQGILRKSECGRPYIGAKGIGKLALLSCADEVSIVSKTATTAPTGCLISNRELDQAIEDDLATEEVPLRDASDHAYSLLDSLHSPNGTAHVLTGMRTNNNTDDFLRSSIAQGFRFSLIDPHFHIHFNGSEITSKDLEKLSQKTQFAWVFPGTDDDFTKLLEGAIERCQTISAPNPYQIPSTTLNVENTDISAQEPAQAVTISGFIATTNKPQDLKVYGSDNRATLDLFVNGRLREKNIVQHIPSARVPEQYIYGQIHVDGLDRQGTDPFTSAREQVIATDPVYRAVLDTLKEILKKVYDHWDQMRFQLNQEGDTTSEQFSKSSRSARLLASDTMESILKTLSKAERRHWKTVTDELTARASLMSQYYTLAFLTESFLRQILDDYGYNERSKLPTYIASRLYDTKYKEKDGVDRIAKTISKEEKLGYSGETSIRKVESILDYLEFRELLSFSDKSSDGVSFNSIAPELTPKIENIVALRNIIMHSCSFTPYGSNEFLSLYPKLHSLIREYASKPTRDPKRTSQ
mgnify:FL=1